MLAFPQERALFRLLRWLRRETSSGLYIPEIDGLRFLAIGSVLLYHFDRSWSKFHNIEHSSVAEHGKFGVQLFFVISGFILGMPFAEGRISLKKYFLRRLTRLEPPYFLNLLLFWVIKGAPLFLLANLAASIFYLHNVAYREQSLINTVAWSLEIEIQFYLLVPVLAILLRSKSRQWLLTSLILSTSFAQLYLPTWIAQLTILGYLQYFLTGFLLLTWYRRKRTASLVWDIAGVLALVGCYLVTTSHLVASILLPWCVLVLYSSAFAGRWLPMIFRWTPIATIGGMCYSIYLYHWAVMSAASPRILRWGQPYAISMFLLVSLAVTFSAVLFVLIERPCMKPDWHRALFMRLSQQSLSRSARSGN